ncbi:hypothetical protein POJ06DRAFT_294244 [Lipomyces tetrasporus]|uniref:Uncharacterized protein n=1 Tax=Lipomyces tetrasporus TaxID=54092 RepID=A0AAD7QWU9_9ASCO|nr:uncharacterized protein POJ06DRAFT_294244 [Lipomyces tetrasporus]KAJ8102973.1 hypothetical protein POJ06DRAFT_294244 [Lipomyces tetrasporus]
MSGGYALPWVTSNNGQLQEAGLSYFPERLGAVHKFLARARSPAVESLASSFSSRSESGRRISFAWSPQLIAWYKKSNTVPVVVAPDTSLRKDKTEMSNYAKALHLLKNNTTEQRLDDLQKSWSKLKKDMDIREDQIYPRLSYNSLDQVATVVTIQRALHEAAAYEFNIEVDTGVREYLSSHSPQERDRIVGTGSRTEKGTYGKYAKSSKEPDGSFFYDDDNAGLVLRVVIEAGHSEHYSRLLRDKDMWMKGTNAKAVVLICLKESLRFKNPHTAYENIEDVDLEVARMKRHIRNVRQRKTENGFYGPVEYRNHRWFGEMSDAFIEVWRVGMKDPVRSWLIKDGRAYERLRTTIGLKISDFLGDRESGAANIPDSDVYFDPCRYLRSLMYAMEITAKDRYNDFILERH